jgi:hypothetical protein
MDVDTHAARDISELTVKEIRAYISGLLTVPNAVVSINCYEQNITG